MSRFGKNVGAGRRCAFAKRIAFLKSYRKFPSQLECSLRSATAKQQKVEP
jgi:hypothetical protein